MEMRYKYIEERYPAWFTNGETIMAFNTEREYSDGTVIPQQFIDEHNRTVDKLCEAVCLLFKENPKKAKEWWYGTTTKGDV